MRNRVAAVLAAAALLVTGCSDEVEPVYPAPLDAGEAAAPAYDPELEPAAAVLALVPEDATRLAVTDFERIRLLLGVADLTGAAGAAERERFWARVATESPALTSGLLRPDDTRLADDYGFTQDDVEWEAVFTGPDGDGWVLKLRDDLAWNGVRRAVTDGVGPLAGASDYETTHVVASGITTDPTASWQVDPELVTLVGDPTNSTYVDRACLPFDVALGTGEDTLAPAPAGDVSTLDPLGAFSVSFGGTLVTAQLGEGRSDVFARARLADDLPQTDPEFGLGYADPVGDPRGGRIGWTMGDPSVAARLALEQHLPFAVCTE